jgi:hypothetical protein
MVAPPVTTYSGRSTAREWRVPALVLGVAVCGGGAVLGLWWLTVAVGFVLGMLFGGRLAIRLAIFSGAIGWGLALAWQQLHASIWPVANTVAGILGVGSNGGIVLAATVLLAALLGVAGAWIGVAVRSIAFP